MSVIHIPLAKDFFIIYGTFHQVWPKKTETIERTNGPTRRNHWPACPTTIQPFTSPMSEAGQDLVQRYNHTKFERDRRKFVPLGVPMGQGDKIID